LQAVQDELIKIKDFNKAKTIFDRKFKDKFVEDNLEIYKILLCKVSSFFLYESKKINFFLFDFFKKYYQIKIVKIY